ncbi:MAG: HAD family hydrolase [Blautia sp.]|nr:HAD family hydrolase [Blautia sp.]
MVKRLALFDLDGTLFDTSDVNYYAYKESLKYYGYDLDYDFYCKECNGRHYRYFMPLLKVEDSEVMEKIHHMKKQAYGKYLDKARVNEHLFSIIESMTERYNKVIVTTASRENTEDILLYFNVLEQFDMLLTQEDIHYAKPNPEGFLMAMKRYHTKPEDTIIFEDSEVGIEAALLTKATVIAIRQF